MEVSGSSPLGPTINCQHLIGDAIDIAACSAACAGTIQQHKLAIARRDITAWPEDEATQARFLELDTEIEARLWPEVREAMAAAFVKAANDILDRERQRDDE